MTLVMVALLKKAGSPKAVVMPVWQQPALLGLALEGLGLRPALFACRPARPGPVLAHAEWLRRIPYLRSSKSWQS